MSRRNKIIIIAMMLLVALGGILAVAYPILAAQHNARYQSEVLSAYEEQLQQEDNAGISAVLEAAIKYNDALFRGEISGLEPEKTDYFNLLDLSDNGIMGYVEIPRINVTLPIYHGTSNEVLDIGAGHIPPTSLPVGGESTHAAISAHTGMASNPMFTDLELLETGDIFYIHVLGSTLGYQVEAINVVVPEDVSLLQIQRGRDLVTLLTCTPYGVNSHRLLVTGQRIELTGGDETAPDTPEPDGDTVSVWNQKYLEGILLGLKLAAIPVAILVLILFFTRKKRS